MEGPQFLTNWSFGQLCSATHSPAAFLRELPAEKTVDLLNYRLDTSDRTKNQIFLNTETNELLSSDWNIAMLSDDLVEQQLQSIVDIF